MGNITNIQIDGINYNIETNVTDTTLTESGVPADAKTVGDMFESSESIVSPLYTISDFFSNATAVTNKQFVDNAETTKYPLNGYATEIIEFDENAKYLVSNSSTISTVYQKIYCFDENQEYLGTASFFSLGARGINIWHITYQDDTAYVKYYYASTNVWDGFDLYDTYELSSGYGYKLSDTMLLDSELTKLVRGNMFKKSIFGVVNTSLLPSGIDLVLGAGGNRVYSLTKIPVYKSLIYARIYNTKIKTIQAHSPEAVAFDCYDSTGTLLGNVGGSSIYEYSTDENGVTTCIKIELLDDTAFIRFNASANYININDTDDLVCGLSEIGLDDNSDSYIYALPNIDEYIESLANAKAEEKLEMLNKSYKYVLLHELYRPVDKYCAWCPSNIVYNSSANEYIFFANCTNSHSHTYTTCQMYRINAVTFEVTETVALSGCTFCHGAIYIGSTLLLIGSDGTSGDGTYWNRRYYTSTDNGATWTDNGLCATDSSFVDYSYSPWGIFKTSTGRLLMSNDNRLPYHIYSDDNGATWSMVSANDISSTSIYSGRVFTEASYYENNGTIVALWRLNNTGLNNEGQTIEGLPTLWSKSEDDGETWSELEETKMYRTSGGLTMFEHDGIVEVFSVNKRYGGMEDAGTHGGWMMRYITTPERLIANDDYVTKEIAWKSVTNTNQDFHCPCIAFDSDGNFLMAYFDKSNQLVSGVSYRAYVNNHFVAGQKWAYSWKDYIDGLTES